MRAKPRWYMAFLGTREAKWFFLSEWVLLWAPKKKRQPASVKVGATLVNSNFS